MLTEFNSRSNENMQLVRCLFDVCIPFLLRQINIKYLVVVSIFSCTYLVWFQYSQELLAEGYDDNLVQEALHAVAQDPRFAEVYRKGSKLSPDIKYMLLWTPADWAPFYWFETGQRAFIANNCSYINCYVTDNRSFFKGNLDQFHAIAFNGRNIDGMKKKDLPNSRSLHQKYIFFNMESPENTPVCSGIFDEFFNWTATFRLDSDIFYPYFVIKNKKGEVVGPKKHIEWINNDKMEEVDENLSIKLQNKTKAVAWFVSNCYSKSRRETFVQKLVEELKVHNIDIDVYGYCGTLRCPRSKDECDTILANDYFFYLSLENSIMEDYVTEKLVRALHHDVLPIVYGGADYSRFLPPQSYLNGRNTSVRELALVMKELIMNPDLYQKYFKWHNHYTYHNSEKSNVCNVCAALNDKEKFEKYSSYNNFRKWWNLKPCKRWFFRNFLEDTGE